MTNSTTTSNKTKLALNREDLVACLPLIVVVILTNVWFFTQALNYVR